MILLFFEIMLLRVLEIEFHNQSEKSLIETFDLIFGRNWIAEDVDNLIEQITYLTGLKTKSILYEKIRT